MGGFWVRNSNEVISSTSKQTVTQAGLVLTLVHLRKNTKVTTNHNSYSMLADQYVLNILLPEQRSEKIKIKKISQTYTN